MNTNDPYDDVDERAERLLEDVDYDTELAKRMATDARRITAGKLTEEEYHERYREAVSEEFDVEVPAYDELEDDESGVSLGAQARSRRTVLQAAGVAAVGAATAGLVGSDGIGTASADQARTPVLDDAEDRSVGMVIDTEECIKCLSCVAACRDENRTHLGDFWMFVHRYQREDREYDDETDCESLPRPCQHCDDAPCVRVCPNRSRIQHDDGRVLCNYDTCLGCKYCEVACPYHVNSFVYSDQPEDAEEFEYEAHDEEDRWVAGTPPDGSCSKCTFCAHRRFDEDRAGSTACEDACPVNAIQFGDLEDPDSDPNQYLADHDDVAFDDGEAIKDVDAADRNGIFRMHTDASDPNVVYVGDDPSDVERERVPGPTTHADLDLEEADPY